ncbi:MAG TPA: ABC transporter ATP-binding protein [Candidatus Deferrimicrobium sp.]|nr:ABC transporter ATP-binding protein [Candidatus Kapabacteria bacterium]HLP62148.1 ABC transporter ATP-binding protein [Candidatus Deferrimicrobium sp.]
MNDIAVKFENVSKFYKLYNSPKERLKEALHPFGKKRHREFYALKDINLEVKKGEILGIVGKNGSGKSTLLKIVSGVVQPNSGKAIVTGELSALLELGSGMNPDFNGIQNIYFGGIMMGFTREEMKAKIDDIIAFAEIGDFINQPLKTYSSGMKARLGFSLAINIKPEILVVDEVLSVGDDLFKRKCFAKIEELFKSGCTVFFVSHSIPNVVEICTRAILMDKGELILDGPAPFITRYYQKLLYALPSAVGEIRDEITQLNKDPGEKEKYKYRCEEEKNGKENNPGKEIEIETETEKPIYLNEIIEDRSKLTAYFIPDFSPKTTVKNEFYDVKIFDIQVQTLSGKLVNALVMNDNYLLSYKVQLNLDMEKVKFSTLILSEKGLPISGISIQTAETCQVKTGDIYHVRIHFKCALLPSTYYIGISVNSIDKNNEKVRLYEIHDAIAFKVQEEKNKYLWGIVNLGQSGQIQKIAGI